MQAENPANGPRDLELVVGRGVPVELRRLLRATEHFSEVISEIASAYTSRRGGVAWIVEVHSGSVRLSVAPEPASDEVQPSAVAGLPEVIGEGIAQIAREPKRPDYFSDKALEQLRDLAKIADVDFGMAINNGHGTTPLSAQLVVNVDKILGAPRYSIGTVEGRLEAVNLRDSARFSIWPGARGRQVKCYFAKHLDLNEVVGAIGKRVAARGRIKSRPDGRRESVEVYSLRVLNEQPIDAAEVQGLFEGREAAAW